MGTKPKSIGSYIYIAILSSLDNSHAHNLFFHAIFLDNQRLEISFTIQCGSFDINLTSLSRCLHQKAVSWNDLVINDLDYITHLDVCECNRLKVVLFLFTSLILLVTICNFVDNANIRRWASSCIL